jgi:type VI secretion system protein ImpA
MSTPQFPSSLRKPIPALKDFLSPVTPQNPTGSSLRYDPLYDDVRLHRQEDDSRLSMGIWKTDLKRAEWGKIEDLCMDALLKKTKDIQITAWLMEAWISLDGIEGQTRGTLLMSALCETFWPTIYPQLEADGDSEKRFLIFEWLDSALPPKLMLIPITQSKIDSSSFGLGYYKSAQLSDASEKRGEKPRNQMARMDPGKIVGTVEEFQKSLEQTSNEFLLKQLKSLTNAIDAMQSFKNMLATLTNEAPPSFSQILLTLKEMVRICSSAIQQREPSPEDLASEAVIEQGSDLPHPSENEPEYATESDAEVETHDESAPLSEDIPDIQHQALPETDTQTLSEPIGESQDHSDLEEISLKAEEPKEATTSQLDTPLNLTTHEEISKVEAYGNGEVKTRKEAYRQLAIIANFLEESDRHSVAPPLINQLIKWENKSIFEIFDEIAKTPEEYEILKKVFGISYEKKE